MNYNLYIATDTKDGGIYHYKVYGDTVSFVSKTDLHRPQYMCINNNRLYVTVREVFEDGTCGLTSFDIDEDGNLINQKEAISTKGEVACHLCIDENDDVYVANYISGSVIKMPDKLIQHRGSSENPQRQSSPHAHYVTVTPDNKYVAAVDLGIDAIVVYDKDMNFVSKAQVPKGHGARHIVFDDSGEFAFCANELKSSLSVLKYDDGKFELLYTTDATSNNDNNNPSAIRYLNNRIYIANRGEDTVSIFDWNDGVATLSTVISTYGSRPRDIYIIDNKLYCANEESDNVTVYEIEGTTPKKTDIELKLSKPFCIIGKEIKNNRA